MRKAAYPEAADGAADRDVGVGVGGAQNESESSPPDDMLDSAYIEAYWIAVQVRTTERRQAQGTSTFN